MDPNTIKVIDFLKSAETQVILNGLDSEGTPWLDHVFSIYQNYFGETCTTCPSKIMGYIEKIKHLKPESMSTEERKYLLKQGAVIRVFGSTAYSNANLTDEVAEKLLKENPNRSSLFAKMPKDAKEAEPPAEKALAKMNKSELFAKANDLGITEEETVGKSNPELVKLIEAKQAETDQ